MPLSRYSIRNSYSLADPELYRAADKDDPEALLEGVAMAGLVGVLRQLGDLAEFAAEIFHDLHEDLMATAARGHGLTVRVQQIEAEFPSIEKAFLSHTSHSSFYYNTGVDWHPTVHMDQNLVTQGDLPRFVMDSYEECRGPPRLFLLDKFDVAGAGSCLKRYTDPSFFKTESPLSVMPSAEVQREKKGRKSKKKGSRLKNAETPEVLSTSHVKLQQLLLEERVENHVSDPARRVKLKRRLNGSPFDSTLGKSYMDAVLKIPTPEPDIVREISITSSPLKILTSLAGETENKVLDITAISPDKDTIHRKRSTYSSSDSEAAYKPSNHSSTEEYSGISPNSTSTQIDHVHSTPNEVDKKEIVAERVRKIVGNQSDDEVDNYVDALTSMDSEMETDTEYRAKNDMRLLNVNGRRMGSDVTEELSDIQTHSTDGQSIVNSSLTDGGNSISRRGKSSFTNSGSPDLAENTPSEEVSSAKTIQSIAQREPSSCSSITESNTMVQPADPVEHFMKRSLLKPELDVISSNHSNLKEIIVNNGESSFHLFKNIPWTSNYDSRLSRTNDADSSKMSLKSMDEENEQDTHESYASLHLPSVLLLDSGNNSNEVSRNGIMQGDLLENEQISDSVGSPVQSLPAYFSHKEEFVNSEIETCYPVLQPKENASEETVSRCSSILDCSGTADLVDMQLCKPENDHMLDPGVGFSHYQEVKLDGASSSLGDGEELSGSSFDNDLVQKDDGGTYFTSEIGSCRYSQHAVDVDDGIKGITYLQDKNVATAVSETNLDDNGGDATSLDTRSMTLQAKRSLVVPDLQQNDLKSDEQHIHKSSLEETVNEQANVFSELEPNSSETQACDDYSDLDSSHRVSDSFSGESSGNSSHLNEENAAEISYQHPEDAEAKSLHNVNVIEREEYAQSSPTRHIAGISTAQDLQVEFYNGQFDVESWHDLVSELKSTHHAVAMEDTENVLSSPKNHLAEVGNFDHEVESQNGTLDVKSCHVTLDQVPELEYSHQTCVMDVGEDISSSTHHATELRIPLEEKIEPQKDQFEFESGYAQTSPSTSPEHIDSIENAEDSISLPTLIKAELRASGELKDESLTNTFADEPCQRQHSDPCDKTEASVAPFTYDTTELNPEKRHEVEFQNNQFEVKSWHHEGFVLEYDHQIIATESSETVLSSDTKIIAELTTPIDQTCELQDQFNQKSGRSSNANVDPLSLFRQPESSIPNIQEKESYPSSEISAVHLPNQPSVSQFLPQLSVSKPAEDPLISQSPTVGLLPKASLEEMPPLPPLPPMQWISGKAPLNFPAPEENLSEHSIHSVPPLIATTKDKSLLVHPTSGAENSYPSNFSLEIHNSQNMDADQADYVVHSSYTLSRPDPDLVTIAPSGLAPQMDHSVKSENVLSDFSRGILRQGVNPFSPPTTVENTSSALPLSGKTIEPIDQPAPSTSCKLDNNIQGEAIVSEEKTLSLPTTTIHVYEKQPVLSTSEQHATWTSSSSLSLASSEDGTPNGNEKIKLPRPRNPFIDAVVALDKSKLRKVTQLPQAQLGQKGEERDSLLEQIRAKSFNLKPTVVTRPSIQGPQTNLRLAAILEKANAIRQAFAGNGSDEDDDEDRWSDS